MFQPFRSWLLLGLLGLPLLTATVSCSKKEDATPVATTGAVEGNITPAGSLTTVTATNGNGLTFLATPNASTGAFALTGLAPGRYNITFTPASGFGTPAPRAIDIVAGQTTAAGTVLVQGDGTPRGTVSWTADGITYTAPITGGFLDNQNFRLQATGSNAATSGTITFDFRTSIATTGTYVMADYMTAYPKFATYAKQANGQTINYSTMSAYSGTTGYSGSGSLVVTYYDANTRALRGTFDFTAANSYLGSISYQTISNGTFSFSF